MSVDVSQVHFSETFVETKYGKMFTRFHTECLAPKGILVLVHGMIISGSYMMPAARFLSTDFHVYVPDLPGYGRSEKPKSVLNIAELAEALISWMDALPLKKAHFAANSFGCQIAAEVAARYPERVEKLVLQGPTVDAHARNILRQAIRLKINSFRESKRVGMISARDYKAAGIGRVLKTIRMTLKDHIEEKLPLITAPTLIVRGDRDVVVPEGWAQEVVKMLPHAELTHIPNGAHTLNYSEPQQFASVIRNFLVPSAERGV